MDAKLFDFLTQHFPSDDLDMAYRELIFDGTRVSSLISEELFYFSAQFACIYQSNSVELCQYHYRNFLESDHNNSNKSLLDCMAEYLTEQKDTKDICLTVLLDKLNAFLNQQTNLIEINSTDFHMLRVVGNPLSLSFKRRGDKITSHIESSKERLPANAMPMLKLLLNYLADVENLVLHSLHRNITNLELKDLNL